MDRIDPTSKMSRTPRAVETSKRTTSSSPPPSAPFAQGFSQLPPPSGEGWGGGASSFDARVQTASQS